MDRSSNKQTVAGIARYVVVAFFSMVLISCGGGGGSPGATGSAAGAGGSGSSPSKVASAPKMTLVLTDSTTGAASNTLSNGTLFATASVVDDTGAPVANTVVSFTLSSTIAVLTPVSGTALTDASGVAKIGIQSANLGAGAVSVAASATVAASTLATPSAPATTTVVTAQAAFQVGAATSTAAASIKVVSTSPVDGAIVIKGAGGNGRSEVALVTFKVVDSTNAGTADKLVNFTVQSTQAVSLGSNSAKTNADGTVSVAVNSGPLPTTVRVVATVAGTAISTISDTVTVTTGLPVQGAFSISQEKFYVEGANFDNILNKITILVADANGQTVADGTQVVFTTDSGAIVGTNGSYCLTLSGACSVNWRSQAPRLASQTPTVTATATNGTSTLSTSARFFSSGSFASIFLLNNAGLRISPPNNINIDFGASCSPVQVNVEIADTTPMTSNPLPEGTTVNITDLTNSSATIAPAKISYDGRAIAPGGRGTIHALVVTPGSNCSSTGATTSTGVFNIKTATPRGIETLASVTAKFKSP